VASVANQDGPGSWRPGAANWILAGLVGAFGVVIFVLAVRTGRADSALLFVGLPVLLAVALLLAPGGSTHGRVFSGTTVLLLLAAVALHEGAICVLLAAPLVYLIAHSTAAVIEMGRRPRRHFALLAMPLLLVAAVEGTSPGMRVDAEQAVQVVRVVPIPADLVLARLAAGPQPAAVRSVPLRLLGMPMPEHVAGGGLDPGDRWTFAFHQTSHGPGGQIVADVDVREPARVGFRFVEDTAITARWFSWQHADVRWRGIDAGHTELRLTVDYRRGLDPSWYFGPLQQGLLHEGMLHLLDMLGLR
jgi:hypothetical protein